MYKLIVINRIILRGEKITSLNVLTVCIHYRDVSTFIDNALYYFFYYYHIRFYERIYINRKK